MLLTLILIASLTFGASLRSTPLPLPHHVMDGSCSTLDSDPLTGHWSVTFKLDDFTVPGEFNLHLLDDGKIEGTAHTDHTGPGTVTEGKWMDGKLSFTLVFASHDSIVVTGKLEGGKLTGEFATEGHSGTWEATRA
ncbi:MAG TPA: hypothetical protein VI756_00245 [Blastocatellia bacterium]